MNASQHGALHLLLAPSSILLQQVMHHHLVVQESWRVLGEVCVAVRC